MNHKEILYQNYVFPNDKVKNFINSKMSLCENQVNILRIVLFIYRSLIYVAFEVLEHFKYRDILTITSACNVSSSWPQYNNRVMVRNDTRYPTVLSSTPKWHSSEWPKLLRNEMWRTDTTVQQCQLSS